MALLYAWACPATFTQSPVDHTWVTAFDNRSVTYSTIGAVTAHGAEYWYCWGDYHAKGQSLARPAGLLGIQDGDLANARCIAEANARAQDDDDAKGTIFLYGLHGVCHQAANQVLAATALPGTAPLTVQASRGYRLSQFIWRAYGRNRSDWHRRAGTCAIPDKDANGFLAATAAAEDFDARARMVLGDTSNALGDLRAIRDAAQAEIDQKATAFAGVSATEINQRNRGYFKEAEAAIGAARYEALFEHPAGVYADLVDPAVFDRQG